MGAEDHIDAINLAEAEIATAVAILIHVLGQTDGERAAHNIVADYAGGEASRRRRRTLTVSRTISS